MVISRADATPTDSAPPPRSVPSNGTLNPRVAVVINGNAKNATEQLISTLDQILQGGDLFVSRKITDAPEIARTLITRGYGTVLTGGGDGTFTVMVTEVVKEARQQGRPVPRFGLLKLGTGNALAWVVGAKEVKGQALRADIERLTQESGSRPLRLVQVEGHLTPFCGFGADADVLKDYSRVKNRLMKTPLKSVAPGPLSYAVAAVTRSIPHYMTKKMPICRIINLGAEAFRIGAQGRILGEPVRAGSVLYEGPMRLCALSTIPYYGFGLRMFPFAGERDDRMHLRVAAISPLEFVAHFGAIWRGQYDNSQVLFDYLVERVAIDVNPPAEFQIGGDPHGVREHVEVGLSAVPIRLVDYYAPPNGE